MTIFFPLFYALLTAAGVLGIGHCIWSQLKKETIAKSPEIANNFSENFFLNLGISWLLGYFAYDGILSLMTIIHFFSPIQVTITGSLLTLGGYCWILKNRTSLKGPSESSFEIFLLLCLAGFVLFWNLYPAYDVDSLAFYFTTIKNFLSQGGREFSVFTDIRQSLPLGENYLFSLGFALQPSSTLFQQILHGISKVMLLFSLYGAARSFKIGFFSFIAAAFILSEEHLIASGANVNVRINMLLTMSLFFICFGIFVFCTKKRKEYLVLSVVSVLYTLLCKYLGVAYFGSFLAVLFLLFFYNQDLKGRWNFSFKTDLAAYMVIFIAMFFVGVPYVYNWIVTGSPIFPAPLGPLKSWCYDQTAIALAKDYHYHLSVSDALKNITSFMIWPGILSSKILFPLGMLAGSARVIMNTKQNRNFNYGMAFFMMSIFAIILNEIYIVFEMRYYRYGIGIYAMACTFLIKYLYDTFIERQTFLKKWDKFIQYVIVFFICSYCIHYSFDVMGHSRPSSDDIIKFLKRQKTENEIIAEFYPKQHAAFNQMRELPMKPNQLGFLISFNWPHAIYPINGKNIAFINAAGFKSEVYFDEGLFAEALLKENIIYIFNQLVSQPDYPLTGGAVYGVFDKCGNQISKTSKEFLELSSSCLETLAAKKDIAKAERRLKDALLSVESSYPQYEPFNPPTYGGPSGVVR